MAVVAVPITVEVPGREPFAAVLEVLARSARPRVAGVARVR
jgi:hypothetical protein